MIIASLLAALPNVVAQPTLEETHVSGWVMAVVSVSQFLLTVGILLWRISGMLEKKIGDANSLLASSEASLRANIMAIQADLTAKISQVELDTTRQFLTKEATYQLVSEIKGQNKDDFLEVKEWLKRLEGKIDKRSS